jgi:hypothetical protein
MLSETFEQGVCEQFHRFVSRSFCIIPENWNQEIMNNSRKLGAGVCEWSVEISGRDGSCQVFTYDQQTYLRERITK